MRVATRTPPPAPDRLSYVPKAGPRWASTIEGGIFHTEMAKVVLSDNPMVKALPQKLKDLWQTMNMLSDTSNILGLPAVAEYPKTKEIVSIALNSLSFGKATVRMAAAVQALTSGKASDLKSVRDHSADLPKEVIESLRFRLDADGGGAQANGSGAQASGSGAQASNAKRRGDIVASSAPARAGKASRTK